MGGPVRTVPAYWHVSENFGDLLSPYLIEKISGKPARFVDHSDVEGPVPYLVTGSILDASVSRGIVWGTGCAFANDLDDLSPPSPTFRIVATRGPWSKERVERAGHAPVTCGDPGFLLPSYYQPKRIAAHKLGIICSWVDHAELSERYAGQADVINSLGMVEEIATRLCQCESVVSSCLHGLVAAVAYGIPTVWAKSDRLLGDGTKFRDVLGSLGIEPYRPIEWSDVDSMRREAWVHPSPDVTELLACCPFSQAD